MQTSRFSVEQLSELETLTHRYARYSRSAGGIASVLGGVFCLASYLLGGLLPDMSWWARAVLVALPILWLLIKQSMVRHYYQRMGHVEERETSAERLTHRACLGVALVVAVLVTITIVHDHVLTSAQLGYLALVWLLVLAVWRWLRSPLDFIVGVFLFCQAALLCTGHAYPIIGSAQAHGALPMALMALMFPLAALGMIGAGVRDHRHFLDLRERLNRLRTGGDA